MCKLGSSADHLQTAKQVHKLQSKCSLLPPAGEGAKAIASVHQSNVKCYCRAVVGIDCKVRVRIKPDMQLVAYTLQRLEAPSRVACTYGGYADGCTSILTLHINAYIAEALRL